jgi:CRISPR-associated endonuclease/helicase Cas3
MFLESEKNLDVSKNIFYLQAPIADEENDKNQYEKVYVNRLFYQNELILTTHVNLFDILFGINKESNFALWQLYGSVVILDEIQSYNNNLWWYMAEFFSTFSEVLNLKIIIMSATLPKIDKLLENKNEFFNLLDSKKYFQNPLFKDRVKVDFSLIDEGFSFEEIKKRILNHNRVLIEFIKKESAREFYEYIKDLEDYEVYELNGDDNKIFRDYVIKRTKEAEKIIVVSTQVIEAGVDIDMEVGFKDIATIDSDEQFIGRINRNSLQKGKAYFFDNDDESNIYKKDNRIGISLRDEKYRKIFLNKEFELYYDEVLKRIKEKGNSFNGIETNIESFKNAVKKLDFNSVNKLMKLINDVSVTVFFPYKIELKGIYKLDFVDEKFINNGFFDGYLVWRAFKELNEIKNFAKREIEKSKLNYLMQFFTFNLPFVKKLNIYDDECCGIYLVEDYENYIDKNFKFDRRAFLDDQKREYNFL